MSSITRRLRVLFLLATLATAAGCSLNTMEPEREVQQDTLRVARRQKTLTVAPSPLADRASR